MAIGAQPKPDSINNVLEKKKILINPTDNFYVMGLKAAMNRGMTFDEAVNKLKEDIEKGPQGGEEHIAPFNEAVEQLRSELNQSGFK